MIKTSLVDPTDSSTVEVESYWRGPHPIASDERAIMTTDPLRSHSTFKTLSYSGAGTTQLVLPNADSSLILTDLILTADKVNGGSVEVLWTDGTNTATILKPTVTDAPVAVAISFNGRNQGWINARVDVIVTNAVTGSVYLGYAKVPIGLSYLEWDSLR